MQQLADGFARERERLEGQWSRGEMCRPRISALRCSAIGRSPPAAFRLIRGLRVRRSGQAPHHAPSYDGGDAAAATSIAALADSSSSGMSAAACCRLDSRRHGSASAEMPALMRYDAA